MMMSHHKVFRSNLKTLATRYLHPQIYSNPYSCTFACTKTNKTGKKIPHFLVSKRNYAQEENINKEEMMKKLEIMQEYLAIKSKKDKQNIDSKQKSLASSKVPSDTDKSKYDDVLNEEEIKKLKDLRNSHINKAEEHVKNILDNSEDKGGSEAYYKMKYSLPVVFLSIGISLLSYMKWREQLERDSLQDLLQRSREEYNHYICQLEENSSEMVQFLQDETVQQLLASNPHLQQRSSQLIQSNQNLNKVMIDRLNSEPFTRFILQSAQSRLDKTTKEEQVMPEQDKKIEGII